MLVHSLNVAFLVSLERLKFTLKLQWKKCEQAALCSAVKAWLNFTLLQSGSVFLGVGKITAL